MANNAGDTDSHMDGTPLEGKPDRSLMEPKVLFQIISFGVMFGFAVFFAIMEMAKSPSCATVLGVFSVSALVFHSTHIECVKEYGPLTAPPASLIVAACILVSNDPRTQVLPYVPVLVVVTCLVTLGLPAYLGLVKRPSPQPGHAVPTTSRAPSNGGQSDLLVGMERSVRYSPSVSASGNHESLSDVAPFVRRVDEWDCPTLGFFQVRSSSPGLTYGSSLGGSTDVAPTLDVSTQQFDIGMAATSANQVSDSLPTPGDSLL